MKIGVSGASGHVGKAVVAALVERGGGHEIVGISRTPDQVAGVVEARTGDYDDPASLRAAYGGLDRLLLIPGPDLRPGIRAAQSLAAIEAALAAGVGHIFILSAAGTREKAEPAIGAGYWVTEQALIKNAPKWTILRMNFFAETLAEEAAMAFGIGTLTGLAESRVAYVSRADVAAALAGALLGEGHVGAIYNLTGPQAISGKDRAATLSAEAGKPLGFTVLSEDQLRGGLAGAGLPGFIVDAIASMQQSFADGAYDIVTGDVEKLTGRAPRPLRDAVAGLFA